MPMALAHGSHTKRDRAFVAKGPSTLCFAVNSPCLDSLMIFTHAIPWRIHQPCRLAVHIWSIPVAVSLSFQPLLAYFAGV